MEMLKIPFDIIVSDIEENIDDELADYKYLFTCVINVILTMVNNNNDTNVVMNGKNKLLNSPEQDINTAKDFLEVIDEESNIHKIITPVDNNVEFNVKIGKDENGGIEKCAIVTANSFSQVLLHQQQLCLCLY